MRRQEVVESSELRGRINVASLSDDGGRWKIGNGAFTTSGSCRLNENKSLVGQISGYKARSSATDGAMRNQSEGYFDLSGHTKYISFDSIAT